MKFARLFISRINEVYKDLKHQVESLELYFQLQKGKVYPKDAQVVKIIYYFHSLLIHF